MKKAKNYKKHLLSLNEMILKAHREILRLIDSEEYPNIENALNAAFTVYHLLDWIKKDKGLTLTTYSFCEKTGSWQLMLLHDIVTHLKHATVSSPLSKKNYIAQYDDQRASFQLLNKQTSLNI